MEEGSQVRTARITECSTKTGPWLKWSYEVWILDGDKRTALIYVDSIAEVQHILNVWNVRLDVSALEGSKT